MEKLYRILKLIIAVLVFAVILTGAYVLYDRLSAAYQPEEDTVQTQRQEAPDFTVYDDQGQARKLSDFRGKPVVLNFWASWCGPCRSEMPDFEEMYQQYGQQVHFVMVNLTDGYQETAQSARSFLEEAGYTFPVYLDTELSAAVAYGVTAVPATYFVDAEGYLVSFRKGAVSAQQLQQGIENLLGK